MRLDVVVPNTGPYAREAIAGAARFEAMGYDGLWLTDHVIGVPEYTMYGGYWLEVLTTLAHVAGMTERIRLGIGVLILPYRDAVLTAKMLASLDVLSRGRLDVGVGTGWAEREYEALGRGALFADRGAVTDEALDVFAACWKGGELSHSGRWSQSSKIRFEPTPVQKPGPPIWVGARALKPRPMRRAAAYADVWHPTGLAPEEVRTGGERLDQMAGRKVPRSIRFRVGDAAEARDAIRRYQEAGCFAVALDFSPAETFAQFCKTAEAVVEGGRA